MARAGARARAQTTTHWVFFQVHFFLQPSLNELPVTATSQGGRKRAEPSGAENKDPALQPPDPKQPRTVEISLPESASEKGGCVSAVPFHCKILIGYKCRGEVQGWLKGEGHGQ